MFRVYPDWGDAATHYAVLVLMHNNSDLMDLLARHVRSGSDACSEADGEDSEY